MTVARPMLSPEAMANDGFAMAVGGVPGRLRLGGGVNGEQVLDPEFSIQLCGLRVWRQLPLRFGQSFSGQRSALFLSLALGFFGLTHCAWQGRNLGQLVPVAVGINVSGGFAMKPLK